MSNFIPRMVAHRLRHFGTTTGRMSTKSKEINMTKTTEEQLSEFIFNLYRRDNRSDNERSPLSDRIAYGLCTDPKAAMDLATLLAKSVAPEHADSIEEVLGFHVEPISLGEEGSSAYDFLRAIAELSKPRRDPFEELMERPLYDNEGNIDPHVLWARAFDELREYLPDIIFDPTYYQTDAASYHPGIHGEGISVFMVNGAIQHVLLMDDMLDHLDPKHLATHHDEQGWVYSD